MVTRRTATVQITLDAKNEELEELEALAAEEQRLTREQARLKPAAAKKHDPRLAEIRTGITALEAEIETGKITLTVTALSASKYRDLQKNHPPREEDEFDQKIGYNETTFILPLLSEATVAARDHAGKDVPLDIEAWLDEEDGLDPVDTLRWFNTALGLQTGRTNRGPRLRVS